MPSPSRGRLQGYLAGRSVVLVILLGLATLLQARRGGFPAPFVWFFGATGAAFAFTLASLAVLRQDRHRALSSRLQLVWDVAYATGLVYLSGGIFSPLATLYPLVIIGAAILQHRRGALAVATVSSLAYGLLADLQYYGLLHPLNPFPLPDVSGGNVGLQLLFNVVAFYAVSLLSGYLAEELRRTGERLEEAQAEVLDLEHLRDSILQSLGSGLVALDTQNRELFHNRAAEDLLDRVGLNPVGRLDFSRVFDLTPGQRNEARFRGGSVVLGYSVSPLYQREGAPRGSILIFQDLTQIKHLEEELRRSDRLAAVGRLAAGLAHEIRNPLASLSGSVEVLRQTARTCDEGPGLFAIVLRETERLNRLVTNFLHYAKPGQGERTRFALRDLVDETAFFFSQGEGKPGFRLDNRVPEGFETTADRSQLEQLLLNLFRNSVEAAQRPQVAVTLEARVEGEGVTLTVWDDGPGMAPEVRERAFEPFFTAREGGTGLGLATVHRIVENHGGSVSIADAENGGAEFRFWFPG